MKNAKLYDVIVYDVIVGPQGFIPQLKVTNSNILTNTPLNAVKKTVGRKGVEFEKIDGLAMNGLVAQVALQGSGVISYYAIYFEDDEDDW